jgi:small-conductance mechanosensitive channel
MNWLQFLDYRVLDNTVLAWLTSAALLLIVWAGLAMARSVVRKRLRNYAQAHAAPALQIAQEVVAHTAGWFLLLVAVLVGSRALAPALWTQAYIPRIATVGLVLQLGLWGTAALTTFLALRRRRQLAEDPSAVAAMDLVGFLLRLVVWAAVLLVLLDNLGVNITTLIAGLGVGGIAVALAAQNILGDLFASLSIVLDKPFLVGDFIAVGEYLGSVEHVGLKTTRLRSLSGEQLVFSNADLLSSRVRNYGRMFERRVVFSIGVTYQTPADKVRIIPAMIREIVGSQDHVRFDRAHFQAFGDSALQFEVVYYVLSAAYNMHMDIQQNINLTLLERFAEQGIEFAYPTQTLFLTRAATS